MIDENIEKSLKRFLKRKVSVNESVVVKFLITGLIGATLTACGGGGGGGGSSSGGVTPLPPVEPKPPIVEPEKPQVSKPVEDLVLGNTEINGENVVIQGNEKENNFSESGKSAISVVNNSKVTNESNLTVSGENATAISAVNSTVDNKANITLSGEGATALKGEVDTVLRNKAFEISIQNNGTIDLEGRRNIGLLILSKSGLISGMNNGTINVEKNLIEDKTSHEQVLDNNFWRDYLKDYSFAMVGVGDGSKITNSSKGIINVSGSSIGMYTENGNAINDGTINIESNVPNDGKEYKAPIGMVATGNGIATNNGTIIGSGNGDIQGMFAYDGGTVINGEKGKITLTGKAFASGLRGFNGNVINKGNIFVNGFGIEIFDGTAINDGTIKVSGVSSRGVHSGNSNVTNNGNIFAEGQNSAGLYAGLNDIFSPKKVSLINDINGKINIKGENSAGIENHCSLYSLINKGTIEVTGGNIEGIYSYGDNVTIENSGNINLKFINSNPDSGFAPSEVSNTTGILSQGSNNKVKNNSKIEILGDIGSSNLTTDYGQPKMFYFYGIRSNDEKKGGNNFIENGIGGDISINITNPSKYANVYATGIHSNFAGTTINNFGRITINGVKDAKGIYGYNSTINNDGIITINGSGVMGIQGNDGSVLTNKKDGTINVNGEHSRGIDEGVIFTSKKTTIDNFGKINTTGKNTIGIAGFNSNVTNSSTGKITINGDYGVGIRGENSKIINDGDILITSENLGVSLDPRLPHSTGIYLGENDGTSIVKNSGNITMTGNKSVGIYAYNGTITNEKGGKITVTGDMGTGLYISGQTSGSAINNGEITVNGNDSDGMLAELNTTATNNGTITVIGKNSSGMTAEQGATVINGSDGTISIDGKNSYGMKANGVGSSATNKGTINVGVNASGGMLATNGATISNEGIINIDKSHGLNNGNKKDFALQTDESSTIINTGIIKADGTVTVTSGTNYVLGTNSDGSYGKVSAENISVDGNVKVSTEIVKGSYKDSYILDDVMTGKTELKENYKLSTTSVLYGASSKVDEKGNLDVKLSKENKFSDFASKEYGSLAGVLDEALNKKDLSANAKKVLDSVFASSTTEENLRNRLKEISGVEYTNIARQIFDTKDIFKSYDSSIINTLDDYQFNFNFIGNYSDVEAKGNLLGYDSKMTGISGAMKFNDSLYGVIGYGYNDIDFDGKSEGNIKSVHTGIYKDMKLNSFDVRLGVFGEYNFHEVERDLTSNIAKGDFNSYLLGATGEISQRFGDSLYVKPTLSLDVTYGRYEDFTESGAEEFNLTVDSQDYTSIVPAVEVKVGKDFEVASIYSAVKFGYEFGDMNKVQEFAFDGLGKYHLDTDEIENAQTDVKVGTAFEINNFTFNAEVGKEFGKRDREYITAGFTYTF